MATDKELYEKLQSKLSTFSFSHLVNETLNVLYQNDINKELRPFWHCITLIKWSILNCSSSYLIMLKKAEKRNLFSILNDVSNIEDQYHKQELEKENVDVFTQFHAIQNQQFPFQVPVDKFTFPRQSLLYGSIQVRKSKLSEQLKSVTTLKINELIGCLAFLHWVM